jgi:hypothetical protein
VKVLSPGFHHQDGNGQQGEAQAVTFHASSMFSSAQTWFVMNGHDHHCCACFLVDTDCFLKFLHRLAILLSRFILPSYAKLQIYMSDWGGPQV